MMMKNPVRVRVGDQTTTVEAEYAELMELEVLSDERAVDLSGRSLPPSALAPEAQLSAVIDADIAALKGPALKDALDAAGLPKSGTADEQRARLADQRAAAANLTQEPSTDDSGSTEEGTDQ